MMSPSDVKPSVRLNFFGDYVNILVANDLGRLSSSCSQTTGPGLLTYLVDI